MSWLSNILGRNTLLPSSPQLARLFGSLRANQIGSNYNAFLQKGYEENVDVYAVIKKIVDTSKAVPWIVERKTSEGWEIEEDTSIHELWDNPNKDKGYTWDDIQEQRLIYLLATGNSYMSGQDGFGNIIEEVDVLPTTSVTAITNQNFFMPNIRYQFNMGTQKRDFERDRLEHIKFFNPLFDSVQDSVVGLSPIQVAARVVQVGNDRWDADANLLQNRGAIGLITDRSQRPMTGDEAKAVQDKFDIDTTGTHNFGKTKVTNKDLNFIQMAMSSTDLQLIEKGVIGLRAMCNVYGLPSSLFNDPESRRNNNRKEDEKSLYTNSIIPLSEKISAQDTSFIALNHYPDGSRRVRQDFSDIEALQADKKQEAEKDKIVMEGINTVLSMPSSQEGKKQLLINEYGLSDELATSLTKENSNE